jgi:hypothetical protein
VLSALLMDASQGSDRAKPWLSRHSKNGAYGCVKGNAKRLSTPKDEIS